MSTPLRERTPTCNQHAWTTSAAQNETGKANEGLSAVTIKQRARKTVQKEACGVSPLNLQLIRVTFHHNTAWIGAQVKFEERRLCHSVHPINVDVQRHYVVFR